MQLIWANGEYKVSYSVKQVGEYSVDVSVANADGAVTAIQQSPFVTIVSPGQIDAAQCQMEVSNTEANVGEWITVTTVARDRHGNIVESLDTDAAFVIFPSSLERDVAHSTAFSTRVRSKSGGELPISVHYRRPDGMTRGVGLPKPVTFLPGEASLDHSAVVSGRAFVNKCTVDEESDVVVQLTDSAGNPTSYSAKHISVAVQRCEAETCASMSGDIIEGTAHIVGTKLHLTYRTPDTGYYQLRVTSDGADVQFASFLTPTVVLSTARVDSSPAATIESATVSASGSMQWASSFYARFAVTILMPIAFGVLIWVCWNRCTRVGATSPLEQKIGDIEISGQWASRGSKHDANEDAVKSTPNPLAE